MVANLRIFVLEPNSASMSSYCLVPQKLTVIEVFDMLVVMKTALGVSLRNFMSKIPHATVASRPG